ncbi:MAG: hypothetical protein JXB29_08220, partial [Sedimentisphaerales bacterium]|nr:hypothetical protein [Sedimentisphaerales bacterium]
LGGKPRGFLIFCPIFAYIVCLGMQKINSRYLQYGVIVVTMGWIALGASNLLLRQGTAKGLVNEHPEEIVKFITEKAGGKCAVIFTSSPGLTYVINKAAKNQKWSVCSVYSDHIHRVPKASILHKCAPDMVFIIKTYVKERKQRQDEVTAEVEKTMLASEKTYLCLDEDLKYKRMVPGVKTVTQHLPEYRYEIIFGPAKPGIDWDRIAQFFDWDWLQHRKDVSM